MLKKCVEICEKCLKVFVNILESVETACFFFCFFCVHTQSEPFINEQGLGNLRKSYAHKSRHGVHFKIQHTQSELFIIFKYVRVVLKTSAHRIILSA